MRAEVFMKLSRTIAYAVHATAHLARATPGVPIPCSQLAREGSMPERFLLQILRKLVKRGLLQSTCGVAGGYYLSRSPQQISLRDIVEAFDSSLDITLPALDCMSPTVRTRVVQTLQAVSQAARAELQKLTVAELLRIDACDGHSHGNHATAPRNGDFSLISPHEYGGQPNDTPIIH